MNIRDTIVGRRRERIGREGHALGASLPARRKLPLLPFGRAPFVIAEIKRRSPSRGDIDAGLDPLKQAARYVDAGIRTVSILTEEDHFSGSLEDLIRVKKRFPRLAVLRKDFLLDREDIIASYRAGADAVLLIASVLTAERLNELTNLAYSLGMSCLVEVHSSEDVDKVRPLRPAFTGINCRNLETFTIDLLHPLRVRRLIDWESNLVFESGIRGEEEAAFARAAGFSGLLVGEALVRDPAAAAEVIAAYRGAAPASPAPRDPQAGAGPSAEAAQEDTRTEGSPPGAASAKELRPAAVPAAHPQSAGPGSSAAFWTELTARIRSDRPLVKICGLTNREDVFEADRLGADILGFVFAESPRRADPEFVARLPETRALKAAVVVLDNVNPELPPAVAELLDAAKLDVVQFHGDESPRGCARALQGRAVSAYYKALRIASAGDFGRARAYRCPRVLLDASVPGCYGGTGRVIDPGLLEQAEGLPGLWLAGGIGPDNAAAIIRRFRPELLDASSRLEKSPGVKDHDLLAAFFNAIVR
jgi:indole-3-glycerol phosphate synthase/phosphoribosylanthranilate isomerase